MLSHESEVSSYSLFLSSIIEKLSARIEVEVEEEEEKEEEEQDVQVQVVVEAALQGEASELFDQERVDESLSAEVAEKRLCGLLNTLAKRSDAGNICSLVFLF